MSLRVSFIPSGQIGKEGELIDNLQAACAKLPTLSNVEDGG